MKVDWLIVGAGFTGATLAERIASQLGKTVLIVDRRPHIGGNAYDEYNEDGILIHRYGPHIFHTNSKMIWDYLSQFTTWRPYFHRVLGYVDGKKVPIPFNLNSIALLFPQRLADRLTDGLIQKHAYGTKVPILRLREDADRDLAFLADFIYKKVFHGYTLKQRGTKPEDLDASVTARVPIHVSRDDRYFQDRYQGLPAMGYTALFTRMLRHPNIRVLLNTDYRHIAGSIKYDRMIYTGPIDEFFGYMYGTLPYRSLRFHFQTLPVEQYQEVGTINYPNEYDFTRVTEQKHLTGQRHPMTTLVYEYPEAYQPGANEPFYPYLDANARELYSKYLQEAARQVPSVIFAGRLGDFKYYNMDQAIGRALTVFRSLC